MTTTAARWPEAPDDIRSLTDPDAAMEASIEAAVFAAISDLQRTTRLSDGTRSEQMVRWADEFRALVGRAS